MRFLHTALSKNPVHVPCIIICDSHEPYHKMLPNTVNTQIHIWYLLLVNPFLGEFGKFGFFKLDVLFLIGPLCYKQSISIIKSHNVCVSILNALLLYVY